VISAPQTYLRLGLLLLLGVILQISGVVQIRIFGGNADLIPLLVAAVGLFAGSVPGAVTGFIAGFLLDASLGLNMGASSLALTTVGYGVGRFREVRYPAHGLIAIPVAMAATALYAAGTAVVSLMLGVQSSLSILVLREAIVTVLLNALLALPFFALIRLLLRPVLVVDPVARRARRREPSAPGPLGLRGLEV